MVVQSIFGHSHGYKKISILFLPHSLFDVDRNCWNSDLIDQIFNDDDSRDIKLMPILNPQEPDCFIWKASVMDLYIIRSAYHTLMENMVDNELL